MLSKLMEMKEEVRFRLFITIVKIVLNEGIEIYKPNESDCIQILFGDHLMDVVRILGNPNKEFHNEGKLFLNYLELGFDLMVD